jgi:hypothetical protein
MQEANSGIVEMKEVNVKTIEALIEYFHTESVENIDEVAFELFKVADQYNIPKLKVIRITNNYIIYL